MADERSVRADGDIQRSVIVTGDGNVVTVVDPDLKDLLDRLRPATGAQSELRRRFDRLLGDYALFGGRRREQAQIEQFMAGETPFTHLFLTGPSGFGKTALLSRWAGRPGVAYHFIRQEWPDELFLLHNLCQQLLNIHGIPQPLLALPAELQSLYDRLVKLPAPAGRPVTIIIDGLDEAAGWKPSRYLIPDRPGPGVRFLFSSRELPDVDWIQTLRLPPARVQTLRLGAMDAEEIGSLLTAAGIDPERQAALLPRLAAISDGDPFYLKLLVEDVRDGRPLPADREGRTPALDDYLNDWWRQVGAEIAARDQRLDLMGVLTCALGPITREEIVGVLGAGSAGWVIDNAVEKLHRFIVRGDSGYSLCHPRFTEYIKHKVGPGGLERYQAALVAYCLGWQQHHSEYAFRHAAAHLLAAGQHGALVDLLMGSEFLHAKAQALGHPNETLPDLQHGIAAAEALWRPAAMLAFGLVQAGLQDRVLSNAYAIPLYARFGDVPRAIELARRLSDREQSVAILVEIARQVAPSDPATAEAVVAEALGKATNPGHVLIPTLAAGPESVIAFLEAATDAQVLEDLYADLPFAPPPALPFQDLFAAAAHLTAEQQHRLRRCLVRSLEQPLSAAARQAAILLLALWEPDLELVGRLADTWAPRLLHRVRTELAAPGATGLRPETVMLALKLLAEPDQAEWVIYCHVVAPNLADFEQPALTCLGPDAAAHFLELAACAAAGTGRHLSARRLFRRVLKLSDRLEYGTMVTTQVMKATAPHNWRWVVKLQQLAGVDFATYPWPMTDALTALAASDPDGALAVWRSQEGWPVAAAALLAEALAPTRLPEAFALWEALRPFDPEPYLVLADILRGANDRELAQQIFTERFRWEAPEQVNLMPVLLELAAAVYPNDPDRAWRVQQATAELVMQGRVPGYWASDSADLLYLRSVRALLDCEGVAAALAPAIAQKITGPYGHRHLAQTMIEAHAGDGAPLSMGILWTLHGRMGHVLPDIVECILGEGPYSRWVTRWLHYAADDEAEAAIAALTAITAMKGAPTSAANLIERMAPGPARDLAVLHGVSAGISSRDPNPTFTDPLLGGIAHMRRAVSGTRLDMALGLTCGKRLLETEALDERRLYGYLELVRCAFLVDAEAAGTFSDRLAERVLAAGRPEWTLQLLELCEYGHRLRPDQLRQILPLVDELGQAPLDAWVMERDWERLKAWADRVTMVLPGLLVLDAGSAIRLAERVPKLEWLSWALPPAATLRALAHSGSPEAWKAAFRLVEGGHPGMYQHFGRLCSGLLKSGAADPAQLLDAAEWALAFLQM